MAAVIWRKRGSEIPVLAQILAVAVHTDRHLRWGEARKW